jgi:hypothetical protein
MLTESSLLWGEGERRREREGGFGGRSGAVMERGTTKTTKAKGKKRFGDKANLGVDGEELEYASSRGSPCGPTVSFLPRLCCTSSPQKQKKTKKILTFSVGRGEKGLNYTGFLAWTKLTLADDHIPLLITDSWFSSTCNWPSPGFGMGRRIMEHAEEEFGIIRLMPSYLGYNSSSFFFFFSSLVFFWVQSTEQNLRVYFFFGASRGLTNQWVKCGKHIYMLFRMKREFILVVGENGFWFLVSVLWFHSVQLLMQIRSQSYKSVTF